MILTLQVVDERGNFRDDNFARLRESFGDSEDGQGNAKAEALRGGGGGRNGKQGTMHMLAGRLAGLWDGRGVGQGPCAAVAAAAGTASRVWGVALVCWQGCGPGAQAPCRGSGSTTGSSTAGGPKQAPRPRHRVSGPAKASKRLFWRGVQSPVAGCVLGDLWTA